MGFENADVDLADLGARVRADLGCARKQILSTAIDLEFVGKVLSRIHARIGVINAGLQPGELW